MLIRLTNANVAKPPKTKIEDILHDGTISQEIPLNWSLWIGLEQKVKKLQKLPLHAYLITVTESVGSSGIVGLEWETTPDDF